ncbi:50S ribosomal protein L21e [Candidatus Woesearchaeota archaeon]|nr:50S ribosomal protein L21e [Candidatus Woesearchaeota archaeon]
MTTRIGGQRRKTRSIMKKPKRQRGKLSLRSYLQQLEPGQKVALTVEPGVQKGAYFRRFHGQVGVVSKKLGSCYEVLIKDGDKQKQLIVHPVHLKLLA